MISVKFHAKTSTLGTFFEGFFCIIF